MEVLASFRSLDDLSRLRGCGVDRRLDSRPVAWLSQEAQRANDTVSRDRQSLSITCASSHGTFLGDATSCECSLSSISSLSSSCQTPMMSAARGDAALPIVTDDDPWTTQAHACHSMRGSRAPIGVRDTPTIGVDHAGPRPAFDIACGRTKICWPCGINTQVTAVIDFQRSLYWSATPRGLETSSFGAPVDFILAARRSRQNSPTALSLVPQLQEVTPIAAWLCLYSMQRTTKAFGSHATYSSETPDIDRSPLPWMQRDASIATMY